MTEQSNKPVAYLSGDLADYVHFSTVHAYRDVRIEDGFSADGACCHLAVRFLRDLVPGRLALLLVPTLGSRAVTYAAPRRAAASDGPGITVFSANLLFGRGRMEDLLSQIARAAIARRSAPHTDTRRSQVA